MKLHSLPMTTTAALCLALAALTPSLAGCRQNPGSAASSSAPALSGTFYCRSMGSGPCDSKTPLLLTRNGNWGWGGYAGHYTISGSTVSFDGDGGPSAWGDADLGPGGSVTFHSGDTPIVWAKAEKTGNSLVGTYVCQGCQTHEAIVLRADGTWTYPDGTDGGSYHLLGGKLQFSGLSSGPSGWGPATVGNGTIQWGSVVYRKQ